MTFSLPLERPTLESDPLTTWNRFRRAGDKRLGEPTPTIHGIRKKKGVISRIISTMGNSETKEIENSLFSYKCGKYFNTFICEKTTIKQEINLYELFNFGYYRVLSTYLFLLFLENVFVLYFLS